MKVYNAGSGQLTITASAEEAKLLLRAISFLVGEGVTEADWIIRQGMRRELKQAIAMEQPKTLQNQPE